MAEMPPDLAKVIAELDAQVSDLAERHERGIVAEALFMVAISELACVHGFRKCGERLYLAALASAGTAEKQGVKN